MAAQILNDFQNLSACDLVSWTKPRASGIVLGSILATFFVFGYWEYTLITFVCRILQILFLVGAALTVSRQYSPNVDSIKRKTDDLLAKIEPAVGNAVEASVHALTWSNPQRSGAILVASLIVAFFSNLMCDMYFLLLSVIIIFSAPIAYKKNQKKIDEVLVKVKAIVEEKIGSLKSKVHKNPATPGQKVQSAADNISNKIHQAADTIADEIDKKND